MRRQPAGAAEAGRWRRADRDELID